MKKILQSLFALIVVTAMGLTIGAKTTSASVLPKLMFITGPRAMDTAILEGNETTLRTTVQNVSDETFSTPLCVEDITANRHLGCVPDYTFEPGEMFSYRTVRDFEVDGTHAVKYTYLDPNGQWYEITDSKNHLDRAHFTVAN